VVTICRVLQNIKIRKAKNIKLTMIEKLKCTLHDQAQYKLQPARSLYMANTFQSTTIFISQSCRLIKLKLLEHPCTGLLYKYYTNIGLQYITKICIEKPNNQNFHPTAFGSEISIDQDSSVKLKTKISVKVLASKLTLK